MLSLTLIIMAKSLLSPWQSFCNFCNCGATLAAVIEATFEAANEKQAVLMQTEMDIKAQLAKMDITITAQRHAWWKSGGLNSKTVRTAMLKAECTATLNAIATKKLDLDKRVLTRTMNETTMQQCHDAIEAERNRDSALTRLYNKVVSFDAINGDHDDRMRHIDASNEFRHVIDEHTQDIRDAMQDISLDAVDSNADEYFKQYQAEYDEEQSIAFDSKMLDYSAVQLGDVQSIVKETQPLVSPTRTQSIDVDIDTS